MEFTPLLYTSTGLLFCIQTCYHLGLYRNLYQHSKKEKKGTDTPPLSVIVVAKDAASDLQKNLPAILEQDYPNFEVIVIYDQCSTDNSEDVLKMLKDKYPHLQYSFIPNSARYISHKKLGITMGIKASHHEWLVFTETNCRPSSNQWLKKMARNFSANTDIVLGYSNYERTKGSFNRKITFDTLLNSMRFMGQAIGGYPYTGCGRNLAYRKSLYYEQKGFTSYLNLQRGEDDLFINQVANGKNTLIEASPESIIRITAPHYKKNWHEDKLSYQLTSRLYKGISRYIMGFETCTRLLFLIMVMICVVYGLYTQSWIVAGTGIMLWVLRFFMQVLVFHKTSLALGERKFYSALLVYDWMQPFWNFRFKLQKLFSRKNDFMRK